MIDSNWMTPAAARKLAELLLMAADIADSTHARGGGVTRQMGPCPSWCAENQSEHPIPGDHMRLAAEIQTYVLPGTGEESSVLGVGTSWTDCDGYPPLVLIHLKNKSIEEDVELTADDAVAMIRELARSITDVREAEAGVRGQ